MGQLSARFVKTVTRPGKYGDRDGLMLRVAPGGSKQWIWRGTVRGRRVDLGLGAVRYVTLREARQTAFEYRKASRSGLDPRTLRRDAVPTVAEALEAVIATRRDSWKKGSQSEREWRRTVSTYAARLTRQPVDQVTTGDILDTLTPIWSSKAVTAERLRNRLSVVMQWAITKGYRADDPASNAVTAALPKHNGPKRHYAALPHSEVAAALRTVRDSGTWIGHVLLLEFIAITATRVSEARLIIWAEVDLDAALWTIPAARMKAGREHRVPLSSAALNVLREARRLSGGDGLIFPSSRGGEIHRSTPSLVMRELQFAATPHGFRSSFRDWCGETEVPREVAEHCLAHVVGGVEGAYARSDLLDRRRPIMEAWGAYCHRSA